MNLYIKQHVFSWNDRFSIYDEYGNERFYVEGELFSWGKKLHLYDLSGMELAYIEQKLFSFLPRYYIYRGENMIAEVVREFSLFKPRYSVGGFGWEVEGDFWNHEYEVLDKGQSIVSVSKEWFSWGDAYELRFAPYVDEIAALAVVLVIDACIDADND